MTKGKTICAMTPAHVSYNPRLVKEANTLVEAGYDVYVVGCFLEEEKTALDRKIVADSGWGFHPVRVRRGHSFADHARWLYASLRQILYRQRWMLRGEWGLARAYSRYVDELAERAADINADLYIAHNLQALPAAWWAAKTQKARLGFDAEDYHRGQFAPDEQGCLEARLTRAIEERFLPECDYVTAAAPGIGAAYAENLHVEPPTSILNVFPTEERDRDLPEGTQSKERPDDEGAISLYWYSQVIGHDRGLQDTVRALGRLDDRVHLSLRGEWEDGFRNRLTRIAENEGVLHRVHWLAPVPPDELVARARMHDVGLALEQAQCENRDLCITNKILVYLLAGCAVVATETQGQAYIQKEVPGAVLLCEIGNVQDLVNGIRQVSESLEALRKAQKTAWRVGEKQFNWEMEQEKLIDVISSVLR